MPRKTTDIKSVAGHCKIRKRGSSSSASSSSLVRTYRLKRAVLTGKRIGSTTPVPAWKMALRSPTYAAMEKGKESHQASARRLAATLWEINGSQSPDLGEGEIEDFDGEKLERRHTHLVDQSPSPLCSSKSKDGSRHRRKSSQKLQLSEYIAGMDSVNNGGASVEVSSMKTKLKDVSSSLTASKEIIKVLFRLWSQEEQNSSRLTLVSALRVEIDRARHQIDGLIHEERYNSKDIGTLLRKFAAEKAAWKSRERDRIYDAVSSISRELEIERKLRRQSERLNKRLGRELADSRAKIESEKRAREILEQTCDELAKGLGDDRETVEEMKRESAKVREEVERERQMLQLADVLREERVQMKLAEARYEYEEKNEALERLRNELEAYLGGKKERIQKKEFVELFERIQFGSCQNGDRENSSDGEEGEGEDSVDGELHSIELNMDGFNKSYKWSFDKEQENGEPKRPSVEEVFKGRRSLSEHIQWENICLQRKTANCNGFDKERLSDAKGERNDPKSTAGCVDSQGNLNKFNENLDEHLDVNGGRGNKR